MFINVPIYVMYILFAFMVWRIWEDGYVGAFGDKSSLRKCISVKFIVLTVALLAAFIWLDKRIIAVLVSIEGDFWRILSKAGNDYGDGKVAFSFFICGYYIAATCQKENIARWFLGTVAAMVVAGVAVDLLKVLFVRGRPMLETAEEGWFLFGPFKDSGFSWRYLSFPSGHAATAFALSAFALFTKTKKLWPILMVLAFLTAFARVYTGDHWPSDVFTGAIIGTLCAFPPASHYLKKKSNSSEKN